LRDDAGDGAFLFGNGESFDGAGEIFDGVELMITGHDGDAYRVDLGIEQVGTVTCGVHPEVVDDDGSWSLAYVFADKAEVCSSVGSSLGEFGLVGKLVGDGGMICHLVRVKGRGLSENRIEAKWQKSSIGALLIRSGEKVLLGNRERIPCLCAALSEERRRRRQQQESTDREFATDWHGQPFDGSRCSRRALAAGDGEGRHGADSRFGRYRSRYHFRVSVAFFPYRLVHGRVERVVSVFFAAKFGVPKYDFVGLFEILSCFVEVICGEVVVKCVVKMVC
jgi:hypothetical protein